MTIPVFDNGWVKLYQADARSLPLPDESVDCCVTSPPYWGLRDYGVPGQLGLEPTPEEYVAHMVDVFREVWRVLKPRGTLWLNLGDTFAASTRATGRNDQGGRHSGGGGPFNGGARTVVGGIPQGLRAKNLVGIPWRVAFALQADGWYLRSDIIWAKRNPMPESVTDRPTRAHEYIFLLAKSQRYYYDAEAIKERAEAEPRKAGPNSHANVDLDPAHNRRKQDAIGKRTYVGFSERYEPSPYRNKRSVWEIATQPYHESHFATFPEALVEPCILAGTSPQACPHCGAPWERVVETVKAWREKAYDDHGRQTYRAGSGNVRVRPSNGGMSTSEYRTSGWQPTCSCPDNDGSGRCLVLDPFIGSGTTAAVAQRLGRRAVGVDLNPAYLELASRRVGKVSLPLEGL